VGARFEHQELVMKLSKSDLEIQRELTRLTSLERKTLTPIQGIFAPTPCKCRSEKENPRPSAALL
jgi:hypothetical protein